MVVRVALLGCGVQGRVHLRAYRQMPEVEVVALFNRHRERAEQAAREFELDEVAIYDDYRQLLADHGGSLDLVSVCTMPVVHREQTVAALSAGASVVCEKPFAMSVGEAEEMVATAERAGRFVTLGTNMRFMPAAQHLRRFVQDGGLGEPVYLRAWTHSVQIPWWGLHYVKAVSGGGALASTAVHIVDAALWVAGSPRPVAVAGSVARVFPDKRGTTAPTPEARDLYDVEDHVAAHIRFAGGLFMTLEGTWGYDGLRSSYSFELIGRRAAVQLDPLQIVAEREGKPVDLTPSGLPPNDWGASVTALVRDAVLAVREGREPSITGDQALTVQRIVDAVYRSAATGREVTLG